MVIGGVVAAAVLGLQAPSVSPQDLVEVTDIACLSPSPNGRLVAFRTAEPSIGDNQVHLKWYVAPVDGGAPARMVADGGGPEIDSGIVLDQLPIWAPSSRAFYVRAELDGETQIWRASIDGTAPTRVTEDASDVRSVSLSPDGHALSYNVGASRDAVARAERDARDDGVLIDGSVDVTSPLTLNGIADDHPATLRFGPGWFRRQPLLWDAALHTNELALEPDDLAPRAIPISLSSLTPRIDIADGRTTLHATAANGVDRPCGSSACLADTIVAAIAMAGGKDVLVTSRDIAFRESLSIWTPATGQWRSLAKTDGLLESGSLLGEKSCPIAQNQALCVMAGAGSPPRLVSVDLARGTIRTLYDPNDMLRARTWPTKTVIWTTAAGMAASGQILLPQQPTPAQGFPLVIDYYACPGFLRGGLGDELPLAPLAQAGVATLCINEVGGNAGTEQAQEVRAIDTVTSIVSRLGSQGIVDRSRIGMAGLSFGSGIALAVAERTRLLRAVSISSGQIEPYYYWAFRLPGLDISNELKTHFGLGDPDTDKAGWAAKSPVGGVQNIKAPLLIQIPESEMRITIEFYSKLAASPTPAEMVAYPNETHVKWEPRHKLAVYERNLDWFRFWLLGQEASDPSKAGQYRRWRAFAQRPGFSLPAQNEPAPILRVP